MLGRLSEYLHEKASAPRSSKWSSQGTGGRLYVVLMVPFLWKSLYQGIELTKPRGGPRLIKKIHTLDMLSPVFLILAIPDSVAF
jgi:hypothetical protein